MSVGAWFLALLLFPLCGFASVVDSFEEPQSALVLRRGDFTGGGKAQARVPFVKSRLVEDPERGRVLEMDFNVSQGYGGTYIIFHPETLPPRFNEVRFWLRGIHSPFKVELKSDVIHNFVVAKGDRHQWQEIVIPVSSFSNSRQLRFGQIREFVFVFEDHRTSPRLGQIYVDDLTFAVGEEVATEGTASLPMPSSVAINGASRTEIPYETQGAKVLELKSRVPEGSQFARFRFEASWDGVHWFYLAEAEGSDFEFELRWDVSRFPSGLYFLRGVVTDDKSNRQPGGASKVQIQNPFDFEAFLDEIQRRTFDYFVHEVQPDTYLVKDRTVKGSAYSTGLSGFQFTAYVIGVERGWIERSVALERIHRAMDFLLNGVKRYYGLVPHWLGPGLKEVWEFGMGDVVETSYVLAGALTAQQYFSRDEPEERLLRAKVDRFYREIKWDFFLKRSQPEAEAGLLPWHWSETDGPSKLEIRGYNEAMISYLLALGAPEHAIPEASWTAWASSYQRDRYSGYELIACAPLFAHQYSHLWIDFRGIRDAHANYFENSILATLANREFSLMENAYPPEIWGLTASEGPNSYKAYGAPPMASLVPVLNDGTIAPTAAAGSIMFTPPISIAALKQMRDQYGDELWGTYGFRDSFNPKLNWFADVYLGLDQGPILIAIENYRTGLIWRLFMSNPYIQEGLRRAGFREEGRAANERASA